MQNYATIVLGDKIDLTTDGRRFYKSRVDDVLRSGFLLISAPIYRASQMPLRIFDEVYIVFYRDSGRFICLARVVDFQEKNEVRYPLLEVLTEPEKDQRRESYRLPVSSVDTMLYEYTDGAEYSLSLTNDSGLAEKLAEARASDISITGISIITTKWECKLGDKYLLKLYFDGFKGRTPPFLICGEVMRSELTPESGIYNVCMQFFGESKEKEEFLSRWILTQQQKRIVQRRLIEEDLEP